jgi:signal transduction histidine kinase
MNVLTDKQKDLCSYTGLFGALISATCFIQLMVISREHWLTFVLLGINVFAIFAFVLLALQKAVAPWLLIVVSALLFIAMLIYVFSGVFSLVVLLSLMYSVVIVALLFVEQLHQKLKAKALAEKAEAMSWQDKI